MCFQAVIARAQDSSSAEKVIKLKSLEITHQVNLNRIFKSTEKFVEKNLNVDVVRSPEQAIAVQLVGTMIVGEKKIAWLKVRNQVYQLESGQLIPGMKRQISEINPESVVLIYPPPCEIVTSCNVSLTLTIRDALF